MKEIPILITYERWANSQLSIARYTGGIRINDHYYYIVSDSKNKYTPDLIREDWRQVYDKLGRKKTIGLINNGTTLKVAKELIKAMGIKKEELPKLF